MIKLLPHRFKKLGMLIAPLGFILWITMQMGFIRQLAESFGVKDPKGINIAIAIIGFCAFLFGLYALIFSREKQEDELIKSKRLESFQFSALLQMVFLIVGLIWMGFMENPPRRGGLTMFFISAILFFWIVYIIRFNYIVHIGIYRHEE